MVLNQGKTNFGNSFIAFNSATLALQPSGDLKDYSLHSQSSFLV